jgi:integrase
MAQRKRPARRGNGEGSIYYEKSRDRYRASVTLPDGSRPTTVGKTREIVARKLAVMLGQAAAGEHIPSATTSVAQVLTHWRDYVLPSRGLAPASVEGYKWALDIIETHLGRAKVASLKVERVEQMLRRLADEGYSRNSIRIVRATLSQVLTEAERRGHVTRNVAKLAVLPHDATPAAERSALTAEEAQKLLTLARKDRLAAYWTLALTTGARRGELLGLSWDDLDLDEGIMTVRQALRRGPYGGYELGPTKTAASVRTVRLGQSSVAALKTHRSAQRKERVAADRWEDTGLVFTTTVGTHLDPNTIRHSWNALCEAAGIEGRVPHEMRHTAGSQAVDAGVPLGEVADQLGHADVNMLARIYRHRTRPVVEGVADVMEAFITAPRRRRTSRP